MGYPIDFKYLRSDFSSHILSDQAQWITTQI